MRNLLVVLAVVLASPRAHADSFLELAGGLAVPVSDDSYKMYVDSSLKLAARAGAGDTLGGMASVDWTPYSEKSNLVSIQRFRVMGNVFGRARLAPKVTLTGRFGAGVDVIHESTDVTILGVNIHGSDSDVGIALEPGAGFWFDAGSLQLGVELALPISYHSSQGAPNDPNNVKFDYTSVDFDVLFGAHIPL